MDKDGRRFLRTRRDQCCREGCAPRRRRVASADRLLVTSSRADSRIQNTTAVAIGAMNALYKVAAALAAFSLYSWTVMQRQLAFRSLGCRAGAQLQLLFRRQLLRQSSEGRCTSVMMSRKYGYFGPVMPEDAPDSKHSKCAPKRNFALSGRRRCRLICAWQNTFSHSATLPIASEILPIHSFVLLPAGL